MGLIDPHTLSLLSGPRFGGVMDGPASRTGDTSAGSYPVIYAFGDSLSDVGNVYTATFHVLPSAPYASGHFSNGPVWVEDLAAQLGLPLPKPSLEGGTGFAYGGAETGQDPLHNASPIDLPSQFAQFTVMHLLPQSHALYTLSIGSNDVLDAISANATNPSAATADIARAVDNETSFVAALAAHGGRDFLILNVPDLGKTPLLLSEGASAEQAASSLSALYDADLAASLKSLAAGSHLNVHVVDTYALLDQGVADPAAFGLTNVTQPVWTGNYTDPASGTLNAVGAAQNGYLFFDNLHPTATGHEILASAAVRSLLPTS